MSKLGSVVVVGGGLIGLSAAYALSHRDFDVTVLERDTIGSGASRGNAGLLSPGLATPLANIELIRSAVWNMYRGDSSLYLHPSAIPAFGAFLGRIAWNSRSRKFASATQELRELREDAMAGFDRMSTDIGVRPVLDDYLYVFRSQDLAVQRAEEMAVSIARSRVAGQVTKLSADECHELEPCLGEGVQGGFLLSGQAYIDPVRFVEGLTAHLVDRGVGLYQGARVTALDRAPQGAGVRVHSYKGTFEADKAIVCAGVGTRALLKSIGLKLPILSGKGYSFSVRPMVLPSRVIRIEEAHVSLLPREGELRIAGTMEFDSNVDRFNKKRIDEIVRAVAPYLTGVDLELRHDEWMGQRPVTPDGLPYIGPIPGFESVLVGSGHNMLGLMFAPLTGEILAQMASGRPTRGMGAFRPSRF